MDLVRIKQLAEHYGLSPSKSKGQNFLFSPEVCKKMIEAAGLKRGDRVVEIGPGFGILTEELLNSGFKTLSVELDRKAAAYIRQTYAKNENFTLIEGDILEIKNQQIFGALGGAYHVIANIPYNISSPIIKKFLTFDPKPESMTLLVQDEVAQRIAAEAGEMSILAISVQLYADAKYEFKVSRDLFWPSPEVESAVIAIRLHDRNLKLLKVSEKQFFQAVKFGFAAKRKKLANNLGAGFRVKPSIAAGWLESAGINPMARAQDLSLEKWILLVNLLQKEGVWKTE